MNWPAACAVVIPCLNEEASIASLVSAVRRHLPTVIVVDDGSTDKTARLGEEAGAEVMRHEQPRGKGAALHTGWQRALERGFKWALAMDGDGQHAPEDIPLFLKCAEKDVATLVVGNRMADTAHMPLVRRWTNRWMSRQLSAAAGCPLPDTQCGFRLMNIEVWARLPIQTAHFEIESELLLAFARAGQIIRFVPIKVIYEDERSKIHPLRDTWRWFRWWRRARRSAAITQSGATNRV